MLGGAKWQKLDSKEFKKSNIYTQANSRSAENDVEGNTLLREVKFAVVETRIYSCCLHTSVDVFDDLFCGLIATLILEVFDEDTDITERWIVNNKRGN